MNGRVAIIGLVLIVEAVLHTYLFQSLPGAMRQFGTVFQDVQHLLFRFLIVYAVMCIVIVQIGRRASLEKGYPGSLDPVRPRLFGLHAVLVILVGGLSFALHSDTVNVPYFALVIAWTLCSLAATIVLFAALAPIPTWLRAIRENRGVMLYSIPPALAAIIAIRLSQSLWRPTAKLTFELVAILLKPIFPSLYVNSAEMTLGTDRFLVTIADVCSGLEGVGLMLVFCVAWLWYFRRDYYFPRALIIIPLSLILIFILNSIRIALLVIIGNAGYRDIAVVGFHSQAGWIAFNAVALAVAFSAPRIAYLNRNASSSSGRPAAAENVTATYLAPLLAILAAGTLSRAFSSSFELLYPLRLFACAIVLAAFLSRYRRLAMGFSWRGVSGGILVFVAWMLFDHFMIEKRPMPEALALAPHPLMYFWIFCRLAASVITVPIAEELAYRGYLMRVFVSREFETVALRNVGWAALAASSAVFGLFHGSMWIPGVIAGAVYGLLAIRTDRIGEAVAAHATTNALLAGMVLIFGHWELW